MRVELALIVGIVCFCCWCAYILITMNSTVTIPQPSTIKQPIHQHDSNQIRQISSGSGQIAALSGQIDSNNNNKEALELNRQQFNSAADSAKPNSHQQTIKPSYYYSSLNQGQLTADYEPPPLRPKPAAAAAYYSGYQRPAGNFRWPPAERNRYASSVGRSTASVRQAQEPVALAQVSSGTRLHYPGYYSNRWPSTYQQKRQPYQRQRVYETDANEEQSASSYQPEDAEPEVAPEAEEQQQEPEAASHQDQEEQEDEDGEELPVRDTDERIGVRSFDEQQSEVNERDRHGRPIKIHHKHFINGKPAPVTETQSGADFEAVVNELDPDQEQQQQQDNEEYDEQEPQQSSHLTRVESRPQIISSKVPFGGITRTGSQRSKPEAVVGTNGKFKKPKRESHSHRLSESLTAQQWDDDAQTSSPNRSKNKSLPIVEATTESPLTEEEALRDEEPPEETDMFAGTDRFPFLESSAQLEDEEDQRGRKKRDVAAAKLKVNTSTTALPSLIYKLIRAKSSRYEYSRNKRSISGDSINRRIEGSNIEPFTNNLEENISSLDDLNIRIISDPPAAANGNNPTQNSDTWPASNAAGYNSKQRLPPPIMRSSPPYEETRYNSQPPDLMRHHENGHSQGPIYEPDELPVYDGIEQHQQPPPPPIEVETGNYYDQRGYHYSPPKNPLQAGSHKSKRRKKFKRSKMSEERYKAAKAHKSKKSNKYKKAGMKKAKKKFKKKKAKQSKEFRGSTKGKKGQKGGGQKGVKKGALYYKDKGYKKRGFKKHYKKVEAGDHKTYFDEFRDQDHNKKWKNYNDKHHYSQHKNWSGKEMKKYKDSKANELKDKKIGSGGFRSKSRSKYKQNYKYKNGSSEKKMKKKKKNEE